MQRILHYLHNPSQYPQLKILVYFTVLTTELRSGFVVWFAFWGRHVVDSWLIDNHRKPGGKTMDVREALYTTRAMRRVKPDPIPEEIQLRILMPRSGRRAEGTVRDGAF